MRRQTRTRILWLSAFLLLVVVFIGVGFIPHTPDVTRQRVEADMTRDWSNQYQLTRAIEGKPRSAPVRDQVSCDKGGPKVPDRGPGKDWVCIVTYTLPGAQPTRTRYELFVHGEACYTATDPALIENPSITNVKTGASVANPLEQFDGCFNVYDNRTSTTS